jgi:hypothetical protein
MTYISFLSKQYFEVRLEKATIKRVTQKTRTHCSQKLLKTGTPSSRNNINSFAFLLFLNGNIFLIITTNKLQKLRTFFSKNANTQKNRNESWRHSSIFSVYIYKHQKIRVLFIQTVAK